MISNLNTFYICFNLFIFILRCEGQAIETTVETIFIETTTEYVTIITDIPEEDVEQALNLDYGRYTTQSFAYYNSQNEYLKDVTREPCYKDHIRCLITVVVPHPVCTVNDPWDFYEGYRTFENYCDAYFDNCLRRMRFWRILNFGKCVIDWKKKELKDTEITRRKNSINFSDFLKLLSYK